MRRIANAKQSVAAPIAQPIDLHRQQFDFGPIIELCYAVAQKSGKADDVLLKLLQTTCFDRIEPAPRNYKPAPPVITAVERHEQFALLKEAECLLWIVLLL